MTVAMTNEQFRELIETLTGGHGGNVTAGSAAVMGQMPPCLLGNDKIKRIKIFNDWLTDAESKMRVLNITDQQQKNFVCSCAGHELINFWEKEAHVRFENVEADPDNNRAAVEVDNYDNIIKESRKALMKLVSRDRAIIDCLKIEQKTEDLWISSQMLKIKKNFAGWMKRY